MYCKVWLLSLISMATVLEYIAAILPRILFSGHSILALWLLVQLNPNQTIFWPFCIGLGCLFLESIYTVIFRKGVEYKYFWPSCFFYLGTLVPITWTAELRLLEGRLNNETMDAKKTMPGGIRVSQEELKKFCEIGLMLIIILSRWLLPRGSITRDQLSLLLLEYVAIAADILELFEAFEEEQVSNNREITLFTLGVFSWSLLQFTLDTTSMGSDKSQQYEADIEEEEKVGVEVSGLSRKYLRKAVEAKEKQKQKLRQLQFENEEAEKEMRKLELQGDRYGILAAMFMQDVPFLILRLYLVFTYDFFKSTFLFYIGKNIISLMLMIYRLYVIHFHAKDKEIIIENPNGFRGLSFALIGARRFKSTKNSKRDGVRKQGLFSPRLSK